MYTTIILLPIIGAFVSGFFPNIIGSQGSIKIATSSVVLSFVFSLIAFYEVGVLGGNCYIDLFSWIHTGYFNVNWSLIFDQLTVMMLVVVTSISSLVHIYSIGYMSHDPHTPRFFAYLSIFTFFMLVLVTSSNFVQLFVGWEGVGVSSYLLINFWFTRIQANKSAMKAMIVNRVGDFGLLLGVFVCFYVFKSVDFSTIFALSYIMENTNIFFLNSEYDAITLISILLFVGSVGKSAQIGLHTWLPDAMEGPTPVSALIHAATMVTAGVFLLLRCSPLIEFAPDALLVITLVGAITAFFAATTGVVQNDLKRVIAYSTCSQLGYMVFACGLSNYSVSAFHLMNHAFFKALLFLSAGSIIHAMADEQDIRKMGRLTHALPITYVLMLIASLSLMGIPFLTGFYSKDIILELSYAHYTIHGSFAYWVGVISAFFTAFYSFRLIYHVFLGRRAKGFKSIYRSVTESPNIILYPLIILGFCSVFVGYLFKDMMIGLGTDFWGNSLFISTDHVNILESEFLPSSIKNIPVKYSILGAFLALFLNRILAKYWTVYLTGGVGKFIYITLNRKWFFDIVYNKYIVKPLLSFGYNVSFKTLDRGIIEIFGPFGISSFVKMFSKNVSSVQTGFVYHSLFVTLAGFLSLLLIILGIHFNFNIDIRLLTLWLYLICLINIILSKKK
jgi:NADH-ubiquinone oxidoreductase chain 5